jgi:hypothetical protein
LWIRPPTGYQLRWLAAIGGRDRRSFAFEYLVSDRFALELASDPDPTRLLDYNAHLEATFGIDGTQVSAYVPNEPTFPELTLVWSHKRLQYRLYVMPLSPLAPPLIDPADFVPLVASVRYASPPN